MLRAVFFAAVNAAGTYDVVIVGSGLGGLLSAVILAKEGMKVCVLEKDKQIGGCLQTFALQKKVFDSCVHYIGGLGEGHTLNRIFRYAGIMDKLQLKALDANGFDRIAFGSESEEYPQAIGRDNFVAQLLPHFPNEKQALQTYLDTLQQVTGRFPLYHLRNGFPDEKATVTGLELTNKLGSITANSRLQQVLAGNNLLYAGVRGKTPFYLHALVLESYLHSAHKVEPGSSQIAKLLWQELQQHGGIIHRNAEVKKLVVEDGAMQYVETKDGQRFYGRHFIANIHPEVLLSLTDSPLLRPAFRNRIESLEQTVPAFMLNLVLKPGTVPHRNHNLYWHATGDAFAAVLPQQQWPANYALFFTEDSACPGYADTLSILSYMHFDAVADWNNTENRVGKPTARGASYEAFKEEYSEKLLQKVTERIPNLRGNIIASSAATPLTYRDYTGSPEGSLYGILKDVNQPAKTQIAVRTKIPNLLLTGQNVNLHGVLGVSITVLATCAELVGMEYLLQKVQTAK